MKYKLVLYQLLFAMLVFILSYFLWGKIVAISILLGAVVAIIPHLIFTFLYFKKSPIGKPQLVVRKFYIGEIVKVLLTIILFVLTFLWQGLMALPFFLAFSVFLLTQWFLLFF
jgi:ATP synthase protein I